MSQGSAKNVSTPAGPASGDLGGSYPDPKVVAIQNHPVGNIAPSDGQALVWSATNGYYQPETIAGGGTAVIFDDGMSWTGPAENLRSNRATVQSAISNTKQGIVNLSSDTSLSAPGVLSSFASILGGDANGVSTLADYGTVSGGQSNTILTTLTQSGAAASIIVTPDAALTNSNASITVTNGVAILSGIGAVSISVVGEIITISGAATSANNGSFAIIGRLDNVDLIIYNPLAVTDGNNGSIVTTGNVVALSGLSGTLPSGVAGGAITISGATNAGNNGTFIIATYVDNADVTITNPNAVTDSNNGAISWYLGSQGSSISGGQYNQVGTAYSSTSGGNYNVVGGNSSSAGGQSNVVNDNFSTIFGGQYNLIGIGSPYANVNGGYYNVVYSASPYSTINGGQKNLLLAANGVIGGGQSNTITGEWSVIAGGSDNIAEGVFNSVGGGDSNEVLVDYSGIASGLENTVNGSPYSFIGGGQGNTLGSNYGFIGGGFQNTASGGFCATVVGGQSCTAGGSHATSAGYYCHADGDNDVAMGNNSTANGGSGSAGGLSSWSARFGQKSWSSSGYNIIQSFVAGTAAGDAQSGHVVYAAKQVTPGSTFVLTDGSGSYTGSEFAILNNVSGYNQYYSINIRIVAVSNNFGSGATPPGGPATWVWEILAHATAGGVAIIDAGAVTPVVTSDPYITGWTSTVTVDGSTNKLSISIVPGTDSTNIINAVADIKWAEVSGLSY